MQTKKYTFIASYRTVQEIANYTLIGAVLGIVCAIAMAKHVFPQISTLPCRISLGTYRIGTRYKPRCTAEQLQEYVANNGNLIFLLLILLAVILVIFLCTRVSAKIKGTSLYWYGIGGLPGKKIALSDIEKVTCTKQKNKAWMAYVPTRKTYNNKHGISLHANARMTDTLRIFIRKKKYPIEIQARQEKKLQEFIHELKEHGITVV